MKAKSKFVPVSDGPRQAEAAKTTRLRALRMAKEAADKEAASLEAAAAAAAKAEPRKRVRAR